jgi:outer membrane immunogenic protein
VRGRAGVAIGNVLVFGTAGLAYGSLTANTAGNLSESHTSLGWVAGGGAEVGFTPHWSAKAEWLFLDFSSHNFSVTGQDNGLTANLLRLGVNYHF